MNPNSPEALAFSTFRLDCCAFVLYHEEEIVRGVEKHSLQVLAVILKARGQVATYDDIIRTVWFDTEYGVHARRVNEHVSKLRSLFATLEPGTHFFENLRGRGYRILVPVNNAELTGTGVAAKPVVLEQAERIDSGRFPARLLLLLGLISIFIFVAAAGWMSYWDSDQDAIRKTVKESQMYESLVLNKHPERFVETELDKYWMPDLDMTANFDRTRIRQAVDKLIAEKRRYGDETKCEVFEFQSVDIDNSRSIALVRTLEKWSITEYSTDGTLLKVKTVGPYFVDYTLRSQDGRWLIEKSTTARSVRPTPRLDSIEIVTQPSPGQRFYVNLAGSDFEPVTIFVEVVGVGCPESRPCKVDNGALLEHSNLSNNRIERVPLTLNSGSYVLRARNGDSKPSNQISLDVP